MSDQSAQVATVPAATAPVAAPATPIKKKRNLKPETIEANRVRGQRIQECRKEYKAAHQGCTFAEEMKGAGEIYKQKWPSTKAKRAGQPAAC